MQKRDNPRCAYPFTSENFLPNFSHDSVLSANESQSFLFIVGIEPRRCSFTIFHLFPEKLRDAPGDALQRISFYSKAISPLKPSSTGWKSARRPWVFSLSRADILLKKNEHLFGDLYLQQYVWLRPSCTLEPRTWKLAKDWCSHLCLLIFSPHPFLFFPAKPAGYKELIGNMIWT